MRKFVIIPDSFKGTMSSGQICAIVSEQITAVYPDARIVSVPVADGGEGSVECFLAAMGGEKVHCVVQGPRGLDMESFYGLLPGGKTAVAEIAACAGLPLMEDNKDVLHATTYGVGQLLLDAAGRGVQEIVVGLGGSATNDGGCGAATAAGVRFFDKSGTLFIPMGGTLADIDHIDVSGFDPRLRSVAITAMCDIDNPMYGPTGAAFVFGPQKGADPETCALLDEGLRHLAQVIRRDLNIDVSELPGAGAAGAMGAGMVAFFGAELRMGIETVLDVVGFERLVEGADLIITGEGRIDTQSLRGKAVIGVARRAKEKGIPVVALVGDIGGEVEAAYDEGISGIFSINRVAVAMQEARARAQGDMAETARNLLRFCARMGL